jgi:hypothetical protein
VVWRLHVQPRETDTECVVYVYWDAAPFEEKRKGLEVFRNVERGLEGLRDV